MARGLARSETDKGPWLSLSTMARRVGSPRAWKTRSTCLLWLGIQGSRFARQFGGQLIEEFAPPVFTHLRAVGALEEGSLFGEHEGGPIFGGQQLKSRKRGREGLLAEGHGMSDDNAAVGNDIEIIGVVGEYGAGERGAFFHTIAGA